MTHRFNEMIDIFLWSIRERICVLQLGYRAIYFVYRLLSF